MLKGPRENTAHDKFLVTKKSLDTDIEGKLDNNIEGKLP